MSIPFSQNNSKINTILPQEHYFTEVLKTLAVKPKKLFYYGKIPENIVLADQPRQPQRPKTVAIVGARKYTKYGEEIAYRLAYELAQHGVVIISGLAYGIDSIAHRGALDGQGITVAVLGTPIDYIYPRAHLPLAQDILQHQGCILSEYAPGAEYYPKVSFLARNRLISGLADVVIIVEAAVKSGSLNTAMHALDQGKELLAVPGNITNLQSMGCNNLIKQGALPCTSTNDVLELLFPQRHYVQQKLICGDTDEETAILKLIHQGERDGEKILTRLKMPVSTFNQTITMLEIKGLIRSLGANCWALK